MGRDRKVRKEQPSVKIFYKSVDEILELERAPEQWLDLQIKPLKTGKDG